MALRNIVEIGDDILAKKCREVTEINGRIQTLIDDMIDTMHESMGVGIAAPQVGVARRVCVIEPSEDRLKVFINPEILEKEGEQVSVEGCLSVPGKVGEVVRPAKVKVKYLDREGKEHIEEFTDFEAVVVSHETDHLEGILYVDKAEHVEDAADMEETEQ